MIPQVAASGRGRAQTMVRASWGFGLHKAREDGTERYWKDLSQNVRTVYVNIPEAGRIQSNTRHEKSCTKTRGPPRKAKYYSVTDRGQYREGKVKRTPGGE